MESRTRSQIIGAVRQLELYIRSAAFARGNFPISGYFDKFLLLAPGFGAYILTGPLFSRERQSSRDRGGYDF